MPINGYNLLVDLLFSVGFPFSLLKMYYSWLGDLSKNKKKYPKISYSINVKSVSYTHLYFYPVLIPEIKIIQVVNNKFHIAVYVCVQRCELSA